MVTVQLKIVEEGMKHPITELHNTISKTLFDDDIIVKDDADLELKVKFLQDNDQDLILLALRDTKTKHKFSEKVIHYLDHSWIQDTAAEAHALVSSSVVAG
ncbi:MAG: hypothetical protein ACKVOR_05285 [Flavobacteriales bacterium]